MPFLQSMSAAVYRSFDDKLRRYILRTDLNIPVFILLGYLIFPAFVAAEEDFFGPPLEIGGYVGYSTAKNKPSWSAKNYRAGSVTGAVRLFRGLSLQGGYEGSLEEDIGLDTLEYGDEMELAEIGVSSFGAPWIGLRYEVPSSILGKNNFGIHSLYASLGFSRARFCVTSTEWTRNGVSEADQPATKYHVAEVSGPYCMAGARWRFDSTLSQKAESWIGAYGVDAGIKYIRYNSCTPRFDNIEKADSSFSTIQVFITGFVKMSLFN